VDAVAPALVDPVGSKENDTKSNQHIYFLGGQMLRIVLQAVGIVVLIGAVTIITLKIRNMDADGPSILFPGGELVSGELHTGPDPDWRFTDDVAVIELQLDKPMSSRRIFIAESGGKIYVPSGYMRSFIGRLWKDWAFQAAEGDGLAVARIRGTRYKRQLIRVSEGDVIDGIAQKLAQKYSGGAPDAVAVTKKQIIDGDTWIFELAPRQGAADEN
jgi:hypothetical protein